MTPDELKARGLRVKPMQWEHGEGELLAPNHAVACVFGVWRAWYLGDPLRDARGLPVDYPTLEAARAAAEADHAARIAAQLEVG